MGRPKATLVLAGSTLLDRAVAASAGRPTALVIGIDPPRAVMAAAARAVREHGVVLVANPSPERGMSSSLALANRALGRPTCALVVLLADMPFVDASLVARIAAARGDADVAYPARAGRTGHPVVFGPRVREAIHALPDGDTLRMLRADERFSRVAVAIDDDAPYVDLDTEADYRAVQASGDDRRGA